MWKKYQNHEKSRDIYKISHIPGLAKIKPCGTTDNNKTTSSFILNHSIPYKNILTNPQCTRDEHNLQPPFELQKEIVPHLSVFVEVFHYFMIPDFNLEENLAAIKNEIGVDENGDNSVYDNVHAVLNDFIYSKPIGSF